MTTAYKEFGGDEWAAIEMFEKIIAQQYVNHDLYELGLKHF